MGVARHCFRAFVRFLLDTHTLLWARAAPERLSHDALTILESPENALHVSIATLWECATKSSIGKLEVPDDFYRIVADDYEILEIETSHLEALGHLPLHHRDPFDRMLVVQARLGGLTLLTRDPDIARYDVPIVTA